MGYLHIDNLYKNTDILLFKECYAMEKIHGSSAHIRWDGNSVTFSPGGEDHQRFVALFGQFDFLSKFTELFGTKKTMIYGEVYGGRCQGMSGTYGKEMKFIVFDIKVGDTWLDVVNAADVASKFGLEFVAFERIPTTMGAIDAERDKDSVQAVRNGIGAGKKREGIVLRPLIEVTKSNGARVIAKHKRAEFMETATPREVDPEKLKVLENAAAIANEWVTPMRLTHVLDKLGNPNDMSAASQIIKAMIEDVYREAKGEIVESPEVKRAIGSRTAQLFKAKLNQDIRS